MVYIETRQFPHPRRLGLFWSGFKAGDIALLSVGTLDQGFRFPYVTFQLAEGAVPRQLFREVPRRIDELRRPPSIPAQR